MISWTKKKKYPGYWEAYIRHFKTRKKTDLQHTRFVVFDTETTGLDIQNDRILSIGAIAVTGNTLDVSDSLDLYVNQEKFNTKTVEIHGLLKDEDIEKFDEEEAIKRFLAYIKDAVLVAHHAAFDTQMINNALKRLKLPGLRNKFIDTGILIKKTSFHKLSQKHYSLDKLCEIFKVDMHDRHTAAGDAYITAIIFLKILAALKKDRPDLGVDQLLYFPKRRGLL